MKPNRISYEVVGCSNRKEGDKDLKHIEEGLAKAGFKPIRDLSKIFPGDSIYN